MLLDAAAAAPVAMLFGPEDHGLTNDDLRACQRLIAIDTSPAYASLNLAQAVLLVCYELRRAALAGRRARPAGASPPPAADGAAHVRHLQRALLSIGFLHPQNPEHIMFALRALFGRTALEDHEVRILLGIARQIEWAAGLRKGRNGATGGGREEPQPTTGPVDRSPVDRSAARRPRTATGRTGRSPLTLSAPWLTSSRCRASIRERRRARERAATEACIEHSAKPTCSSRCTCSPPARRRRARRCGPGRSASSASCWST